MQVSLADVLAKIVIRFVFAVTLRLVMPEVVADRVPLGVFGRLDRRRRLDRTGKGQRTKLRPKIGHTTSSVPAGGGRRGEGTGNSPNASDLATGDSPATPRLSRRIFTIGHQ